MDDLTIAGRHAIRHARQLLCAVLLVSIVTPAAWACQADATAAFQDDFKRPDPRWPLDGVAAYAADGQLVVKPDPGEVMIVVLEGPRFRSATYCLEMQTPSDLDPAEWRGGGLIFWRSDSQDYLAALVYPNGTYVVSRWARGWNSIRSEKFAKLNAGPDAVNEIKVTAMNGHLTLYLNGANALETSVQPPLEGGHIGVFASSSKDRPNAWRFRNLTVSGVADPVGRYAVSGNVSGRNPYQGTVMVEKAGGAYRVTRNVNGRTVEGLGLLAGDMLSVSYRVTEPELSVVAAYAVSEQGWTGAVTTVASQIPDKVASETWQRQ